MSISTRTALNRMDSLIGKIKAVAGQREAPITILVQASTELPQVPVQLQNQETPQNRGVS